MVRWNPAWSSLPDSVQKLLKELQEDTEYYTPEVRKEVREGLAFFDWIFSEAKAMKEVGDK